MVLRGLIHENIKKFIVQVSENILKEEASEKITDFIVDNLMEMFDEF